ncbi:hypothetical protein AYI68_g3756 [Smittium mucronatum]|uniref:Uncharacterized protein n=1 Tax=Smittium mucronatum TaxID=133383 RepID=A0A1R0GZ19_9FUNG|nr:hypothetical protein AYI68_g3756 [Smittium mucronatum]
MVQTANLGGLVMVALAVLLSSAAGTATGDAGAGTSGIPIVGGLRVVNLGAAENGNLTKTFMVSSNSTLLKGVLDVKDGSRNATNADKSGNGGSVGVGSSEYPVSVQNASVGVSVQYDTMLSFSLVVFTIAAVGLSFV